MRGALAIGALLAPCMLAAQTAPVSNPGTPRIQTAHWEPGEEYLFTALPQTGLTVVFEPGERIERIAVEDEAALEVRLSAALDSFIVIPRKSGTSTGVAVGTDRRNYRLRVRSSADPAAAYLVRFEYGGESSAAESAEPGLPASELAGDQRWTYRIKGDRSVMPSGISDDGVRTVIRFAEEQALPAIFSLGPGGDEQVVNGFMRDGVYVIDRVFAELVFRVDEEKATARRRSEPEQAGG